jgi:hypothetical protein
MNQVLIGIIVIAILICFFNREQFNAPCPTTKSRENDMYNLSNTGCARIDTSNIDYIFFRGKEVQCKNIVNGVKKGATIKQGGCPKNPNGSYKVDGASGNCAANIEHKTGDVLICN